MYLNMSVLKIYKRKKKTTQVTGSVENVLKRIQSHQLHKRKRITAQAVSEQWNVTSHNSFVDQTSMVELCFDTL